MRYDTVEPGHTMVELAQQFDRSKARNPDDGIFPPTINYMKPRNHAWLHRLVRNRLLYFYFSANGQGIDWVGDHIRPRVRIPQKWKWPVGLSLSTEVGYQRRRLLADTWTWEMRPIVDKQTGQLVLFVQSDVRQLHSTARGIQGLVFSPNVKVSYDFTKQNHRRP